MSSSDLVMMLSNQYHNNTLVFDLILNFYNKIISYIKYNNLKLKYDNDVLLINLIVFFYKYSN